MNRLLELVKPHWRRVIAGVIAGGIVSLMNGTLAWVVKDVVDDVFIAGDRRMLLWLSLAVFLAFIFRGLFTSVQNIVMASVGAKIVRDLRNDLYSHMVYLPMSHFGRDTTGSMMSKVINDIGLLDQHLVFRIKDLFLSLTTIIALTVVAFYRRWDLALIAIVVLPAAFSFVARIGRRIKNVSHMAQKRLEHITESLSEGLGGIKVVKAFTMETSESGKFADKGQSYYREYMKVMRLTEASYLIMEMVGGLGVAFIIYYGGRLVSIGEITSGEFLSCVAAIMMIYHPAKQLARVQNGLQQARAYVERVDHILDLPSEPEGSLVAPRLARSITFDDVWFRYYGRGEHALGGISLEIGKGEVIALVGKSGAGKTTLVDLLARFYLPEKGRILFDGRDINEFTSRSLRSQIGIVSQDVVLFNGSVRDNIRFGLEGVDDSEVERAAEAAYAMSFIKELPEGFETGVGDSGSLLSGGQRQRISIARAILKDPSVLILDEATSALDTESELMIQRALDGLMEAARGRGGKGKTVFVIAHRLSTIKRADRIVVLDGGKVAQVGGHEELLSGGGIYGHLYRMQYGQDEAPGQ
jgi:subfamily B ATP-binding cassette protein MsbA